MKGRNSSASSRKRRKNEAGKGNSSASSHLQINYSGPSFSDLPNNILVNILLRLSIKRIFVCKCVCKKWYRLISDPEFAKLHFDQAHIYPLIRTSGFTLLSRMLYLVQPEQDDFERKLDMYTCYEFESMLNKFSDSSSIIRIKLDSKLKLPFRDIQVILDKEGVESKNCLKLNMKNHKYKIVNSCNGLLCLSNPSDNDPVIVCNPVTGEFIYLPEVRTPNDFEWPIDCGFGFSPVTNQYKVIRMFTRWTEQGRHMVAEVHVLGTETWKDLSYFPESTSKLFPTYLNGFVYWFSPSQPCSVISFDVEKEYFKSSSIQFPFERYDIVSRVSMGVLGGKLCITEAETMFHIDIWVMTDRNGKKAWSKMLSIDPDDGQRWHLGSYQPIKFLNNGALLMFSSRKHTLIYYDPKKSGFRYLKVRGMESKVEVIHGRISKMNDESVHDARVRRKDDYDEFYFVIHGRISKMNDFVYEIENLEGKLLLELMTMETLVLI